MCANRNLFTTGFPSEKRTRGACSCKQVGVLIGGTIGHEHIANSLETAVREWPGVEVLPHRFGGLEFRVDRREIGHVHVNGMLDVPFPVRMRRELVAAGRAEAHHQLPHTGWVTFRVRTEHDVPAAAQLLRLNYERLRGAHARSTIVPIVGQPSFVKHRDSGDLPA